MAKDFHWVHIEVFLREGEKPYFLNALLPSPYESFIETNYVFDKEHNTKIFTTKQGVLRVQESKGFEETINIYTFMFKKTTQTNKVFNQILQGLTKEDKELLIHSRYERIDEHGRLSIRLDANKLREEKYVLSTKGAVVQVYFLLAAFPKNMHTIRKKLEKIFEEVQ